MDPTKTPEAPPPKQVVTVPEGTIRSTEKNPKIDGGTRYNVNANESASYVTVKNQAGGLPEDVNKDGRRTGTSGLTVQGRATGEHTQYYTVKHDQTKQTYVISAPKGFTHQEALESGTPMKVPPGVHPDDVVKMNEMLKRGGVSQDKVAAVAADPNQYKKPIQDFGPVLKANGGSPDQLKQSLKNERPHTNVDVKKAFTKGAAGAVATLAGIATVSVAQAADGASVEEIGKAVKKEAMSGTVGQVVEAVEAAKKGDLAPAGQLAKVTAGAAMGAKMGAAAGAAIFGAPTLGAGAVPGAVAGGVVGGIIGGTVAAMDPKEIIQAADQNQKDHDDRQKVITEVRKMSDKDIDAIKNPGDRELMKGIKQAVTTADEAEARANEVTQGPAAGNVGKRQQAMTTARVAASNRDDLIDTTLQNDNDGAGDRVRKFVAERQQPQRAPTPEPQEQTPAPVAQQRNQQMSTTPGMG